jgi:nucleoside-triphosphatase THEP1
MVIIITGDIGIGKTTVCENAIDILLKSGYSCAGILTHKTKDGNLSVTDIQTGEKKTLASTEKIFNGPRTPKYSFSNEGIDFGIRAINTGVTSDVLIVDEVGYLELNGRGFINGFELVREGKVKNAILVIRKELLSDYLVQLGDKPSVFETTIISRDKLANKICVSLIGN